MKIKYYVVFFSFLLASCNLKTDCKKLENHYRENEYCELIVEIPPNPNSVYFEVKGRSFDLKIENCECYVESRWWATFSDKIEKGDTIIKKKGELTFTIRKKDTVLTFNWDCDGVTYK